MFVRTRAVGVLCAAGLMIGSLLPALGQDLTSEIKDLEGIGFQQFQDVSRVFVRTTEPVQYTVEKARDNHLVILLANTRIPQLNNRRFLDTRYFDSPVGYVVPKVIEGPSPSVRIEITLRQQVPYKETQNDTFLAFDFQRPPP